MSSTIATHTNTSRTGSTGAVCFLSPRQVSAVTSGHGPSCLLPIRRPATPQQTRPTAPTWEDLLGRR